MYGLLAALCGILIIANLVCFILVLVKMFQAGQTGLGVVCIILYICTGIGGLIAFIVGWMNATKWQIKNVMIAWTAIWILGFIIIPIFYFQFYKDVSKAVEDIQQQQQQKMR
jgi:hypothetical protein